MRTCTGIEPDQARRQAAEELENLGATQRTPDHDGAFSIDAVHLEYRLGEVKPDRRDSLHGSILFTCDGSDSQASPAPERRNRAVPTHHACLSTSRDDRASLRARKTDRGLAFDALGGVVQTRAQGEIFRRHIGQDRGKKHRNADPKPRRVMDVSPVAPWGVRPDSAMGVISRHLNPFPPCRRRSRADGSRVTALTIARIRNRNLLGECNINAFLARSEPSLRQTRRTVRRG